MPDLKTRLQRARFRLLRRVSGSPTEIKSKSHDPVALPPVRRSASLSKFSQVQLSSVGKRLSHSDIDIDIDIDSQSSPLQASPLSVENEVRHPSAETVVDSHLLLGPPDSLISKELHLVPLQSSRPSSIPSAKSTTSHDIPPSLTLQEPSPPAVFPSADPLEPIMYASHRKIWVRRPQASATLVQINREDLVDDVRDMILRKYANSLGKSFDSPDVALRILPREHSSKTDRLLGPEEEMCRVLDSYYPGGQTVDDALVIDVPQKRTPKPSPRVPHHTHHAHHMASYYDESARPHENGNDYFPPMPAATFLPSPAALTSASHDSRTSHPPPHPAERSMTILTTGHLPNLPSPGGTARKQHSGHRPRIGRHHTSSPTVMAANSIPNAIRPRGTRHDSTNSDALHAVPPTAIPLPTPPAQIDPPTTKQVSTPPVPRVSSPRPGKTRRRQKPKETSDTPAPSTGLLDTSVPPINVLIVEDNMINLRVLGAFMERLKVRWQRAMNGQEAVSQWRKGGFHLVLMDIQLPIMNGLEATKEIRRLERVNSIGVFSNAGSAEGAPPMGPEGDSPELCAQDRLGDGLLFKSPVIIVALTASSLQSDRNEALAAGCNDFLTKPVNFVWLERKVKEWGCMQALIDFDGWRRWKDYAAQSDSFKQDKKPGFRGRKAGGGGLKKLIEEKKEEEKGSGHETGNSGTS